VVSQTILLGLHRSGLYYRSVALADYNTAIRRKPDFAEAYFSRGILKGNMDNLKAEVKDYTKAIGLKKNYSDVYFNCSWAYFDLEEHEAAIADYTKAASLNAGAPFLAKGSARPQLTITIC
jgi:tetratricopeptide (TPR) repeat protein